MQIKNWRPLDLEQVTDNALVSVEDMLGDLTTVATLRIKITRYLIHHTMRIIAAAKPDMKQLGINL